MNDVAPDGTKITAHSLTMVEMNRALTRASRIEPQDVEAGEAICFAVRAVKIGESFKYDVAGGGVVAVEMIHNFRIDGLAFVPEEEVREVVAVMALKILEDEELKRSGQRTFNFTEEQGEDNDGEENPE
jgi:hypothetical protein